MPPAIKPTNKIVTIRTEENRLVFFVEGGKSNGGLGIGGDSIINTFML